MILNFCRKNWSTVANLTLQHLNAQSNLEDPLQKAVGEEIKENCGEAADSVLKKSSLDDQAAYFNRVCDQKAKFPCITACIQMK